MEPGKPKRPKAPGKSTRSRSAAEKPAEAPAPAKAAAPKPAAAKPTVAKPAAAKTPRPPASKSAAPKKSAAAKLKIPSILLEGDRPSAPQPSGPGERYELGATSGTVAGESAAAELPESYGTRRLLLAARDPHWLYAHWDFTADQLKQVNAASRDGHLVLRVFKDQLSGTPTVEQHVHPESRNWFVHVPVAGERYVAQLGYYDDAGTWNPLSASPHTMTPPDSLSSDTSVRFETIPVEVPFQKLIQIVKAAVTEHVPLVEAIQQMREQGIAADLPAPGRGAATEWTPAQERALAQVVNIDEVRRVWIGSLEVTELIRRKLEQEISSQAAAAIARGEQFGAAELGGVFSVSSPFGGEEKRRGFWFNVNAELIIYGATEPNATVTIAGRRIQLRPDGSFSFRFALPDGEYQLPVTATSADKVETRNADLRFRRATTYRGDVGAHPQDKALRPPRGENIV
jgi:uncharacterized protein